MITDITELLKLYDSVELPVVSDPDSTPRPDNLAFRGPTQEEIDAAMENHENKSKQISDPNILTIKDIVIVARSKDHFINATQLCKAGGKKFNDWYRLDSTKELITALESSLIAEIPANKKNNTNNLTLNLVDKTPGKYGGTWLHPDLAIQLAQWISPMFSIQVSRWVREICNHGSASINSIKTDAELIELYKKLEEKDKQLKESDKNKYWLEIKSKNNVSFELYGEPDGVIYFGSSLYDIMNYLYKIGKSIISRIGNRVGQLSTGMSLYNNFRVLFSIKSYASLGNTFEAYIHNLLSPLRVKANKGSQEFFMTSPEWMIRFLKNREIEQQNAVREINEYLTMINKNSLDMNKTRIEVCKMYNLELIDFKALIPSASSEGSDESTINKETEPQTEVVGTAPVEESLK
jgi:hypothetical protein